MLGVLFSFLLLKHVKSLVARNRGTLHPNQKVYLQHHTPLILEDIGQIHVAWLFPCYHFFCGLKIKHNNAHSILKPHINTQKTIGIK